MGALQAQTVTRCCNVPKRSDYAGGRKGFYELAKTSHRASSHLMSTKRGLPRICRSTVVARRQSYSAWHSRYTRTHDSTGHERKKVYGSIQHLHAIFQSVPRNLHLADSGALLLRR